MTIEDFEERAEYQGGYDRVFGNWKIIDIHEISNQMMSEHEVDFYCCNDKNVYLLRLRNRPVEHYEIFCDERHRKFGYPPYLIAELLINCIDDDFLRMVLAKFEEKN